MTAATVTTDLAINNPTMEVVQLSVTDGYTYVSKKFSTITAALASSNYDADAHINVTFSTNTATINFASQSAKAVTLVLFGRD